MFVYNSRSDSVSFISFFFSYMSLRPGVLRDELGPSMDSSVQSLKAGEHNIGARMYHISGDMYLEFT